MKSDTRRLSQHAATVDEVLSDAFLASPTAAESALVARRFDAWSRSSAAGDAALFTRRLARDGLSVAGVRERFAAAVASPNASPPSWIEDADWIVEALQGSAERHPQDASIEPCAFEELLGPAIVQAQARLWRHVETAADTALTATARDDLALALLRELSALCAPALYERFAQARSAHGTSYDDFVAEMKAAGWRRLFDDKPVLLRLVAVVTRQWLDTSAEMIARLAADMPTLRRDLLRSQSGCRVAKIAGDLSDPHNGGRSVRVLTFEDGARVAYKPKDLRLDAAWQSLIDRLNHAGPPIDLRAARTLAREDYGWTEFVDHDPCGEVGGFQLFFRRAGAWLALFHVFAATDMHQENMIACGDHPVPIDLETILQPSAEEHKPGEPEGAAYDAAMDTIANSVLTVGLLPAYGRSVDNAVFAMGGMTADWGAKSVIIWNDINSDAMRPARTTLPGAVNSNLPHSGGRHAQFADHVEDFVGGFAAYAHFLSRHIGDKGDALFDGFAQLPVRRVIRPTRFYYMLLQRLKDRRSMDDGIVWSAQADFVARLSDWDRDDDPLWPLHRAERAALLELNVPHFTSPSDGSDIADANGIAAATAATPGLTRARLRAHGLNEREIDWQVEVIRESANAAVLSSGGRPLSQSSAARDSSVPPTTGTLRAEADRIAAEIANLAVRRKSSAAWIGLDWLGDSEVFQLVCLGPDLYNGSTGIALFLAAHAAVSGNARSRELAYAGVARLRRDLQSRNAPRLTRALGIGGASGLGSIIYAFAVMAKCFDDDGLVADAHQAARLMSDELIAADKQLDIMGGSAGAILSLLRLHRDSPSANLLARAIGCGEHLLAQPRIGMEGRRSWSGQGSSGTASGRGLNGMSHGAAGFAYALACLAAASGRDDFAAAARECMAFEDASYDAAHHNWPDLRGDRPAWPCQWCHGAPGIGLARIGMQKFTSARSAERSENMQADSRLLSNDVRRATTGTAKASPVAVDTLCCGTMGRIEFLCEAADMLDSADLRKQAGRRLGGVLQRATATGDFRWSGGKRRFNLGLFRGLAGVGYTLLRQAPSDDSARRPPNVLIWE